jgi:hypothetical protein
LPRRRHRHHGRALEVRPELRVRHEAERLRHFVPQRPVADDDQRHAVGRCHEVEDALLGREPADVEDVRRLSLPSAGFGRHIHAARDHAHFPRAELACRTGKRRRCADNDPRPLDHRPRQRRHPPGELDVGPPELEDERFLGGEGSQARREPVGVDQVGVPRGGSRRSSVCAEEERQQRAPPRLGAEVVDDPAAVRHSEVPEPRR